jgi:hypothetical protein
LPAIRLKRLHHHPTSRARQPTIDHCRLPMQSCPDSRSSTKPEAGRL